MCGGAIAGLLFTFNLHLIIRVEFGVWSLSYEIHECLHAGFIYFLMSFYCF